MIGWLFQLMRVRFQKGKSKTRNGGVGVFSSESRMNAARESDEQSLSFVFQTGRVRPQYCVLEVLLKHFIRSVAPSLQD